MLNISKPSQQLIASSQQPVANSQQPNKTFQSFDYYLQSQNLFPRTIDENLKNLQHFYHWAINNHMADITHIRYSEILQYIQAMKSQTLSIPTINIRVSSIRKYYDHLKEEGTITKNPAKQIHIKGQTKRITENPFTYTELETLYQNYATYSKEKSHHIRSLAILGLMLWQGLHSGEIAALETIHIQLNQGIIYIPSTHRSNSRELKLEAKQIIVLHQYLNSLPANQTKLLNYNTHNLLSTLIAELKGINGSLKNAQHIRASVILHWIKMYNKRQVQYMCGHKYISSTQHYQIQDLETLTDLLTKHHPFS
jgi:site-specific recombinase XerD